MNDMNQQRASKLREPATLEEALIRVRDSREFDTDLMSAIDKSAMLKRYFLVAIWSDCEYPDLLSRMAYTCIRIGQEMKQLELRRVTAELLRTQEALAVAVAQNGGGGLC
jgi:hypothetical protein